MAEKGGRGVGTPHFWLTSYVNSLFIIATDHWIALKYCIRESELKVYFIGDCFNFQSVVTFISHISAMVLWKDWSETGINIFDAVDQGPRKLELQSLC